MLLFHNKGAENATCLNRFGAIVGQDLLPWQPRKWSVHWWRKRSILRKTVILFRHKRLQHAFLPSVLHRCLNRVGKLSLFSSCCKEIFLSLSHPLKILREFTKVWSASATARGCGGVHKRNRRHCALWEVFSTETLSLSRANIQRKSLSPPSRPLSCSLLSSFVFISAQHAWCSELSSASLSRSFYFLLSSLPFILWLLPTSLSPALLVCLLSLPLACSFIFFLHWLPTRSFFYACLLTNGHGRCSPRCLNRAAWAEPLKALVSAPSAALLSGMVFLQNPLKDCKSWHVHTCLPPQIKHPYTRTHKVWPFISAVFWQIVSLNLRHAKRCTASNRVKLKREADTKLGEQWHRQRCVVTCHDNQSVWMNGSAEKAALWLLCEQATLLGLLFNQSASYF